MDDVPRRSCFTETSFQLIRLRLTAQLVTDITQLALWSCCCNRVQFPILIDSIEDIQNILLYTLITPFPIDD